MELLRMMTSQFELAELELIEAGQIFLRELERSSGTRGFGWRPLDVVFRILRRDPEHGLVYIKILGVPEAVFLLSSATFLKQPFNVCFLAKGLAFDDRDEFFSIRPSTRIKLLFAPPNFFVARLAPRCGEGFLDPFLSASMTDYFQAGCIAFEDIRDFNDRHFVPRLKGILIKKAIAKECLIVTLLDLRDLINTFKLYLNFRLPEELARIDTLSVLGGIFDLRDTIKKTIVKKLNIVYAAHQHRGTQLEVIPQKRYPFQGLKTRRRIERSPYSTSYPISELVNLSPQVLHRKLIRLLVRLVKILYIELKLFCKGCLKKAEQCSCKETPKPQVDFFCSVVLQNSGLTLCASLKGQESLTSFFEISPSEMDLLIEYLQEFGDMRYSFGAHIDFKSKLARVLSVFEKQLSDKIVWGRLGSKLKQIDEDEKSVCIDFLRVRNSKMYPNGIIKQNPQRSKICFVFDLKVKHVEEDLAYVTRMRFTSLLSRLLVPL